MRDGQPECRRWPLLHPASVEWGLPGPDGSGGTRLKPQATRLEWCKADVLSDSETSGLLLLLACRFQGSRLGRVFDPDARNAVTFHLHDGIAPALIFKGISGPRDPS